MKIATLCNTRTSLQSTFKLFPSTVEGAGATEPVGQAVISTYFLIVLALFPQKYVKFLPKMHEMALRVLWGGTIKHYTELRPSGARAPFSRFCLCRLSFHSIASLSTVTKGKPTTLPFYIGLNCYVLHNIVLLYCLAYIIGDY